ncbi:NUDIX hydrolase [Lacticaseibacillus kribbianus]|uniref:NUDIX hydrolase n=1 Tax=Lacticaseibacillus kribbianus TaxID=2926292 RepID=UPI001CD20DC6|nr:NUDIX hydrolase [Lacticaseibacillus kribbianus]
MDYIQDLRRAVGHAPVILTFAGGIVSDADGAILLQERSDGGWGLPGGALEFGETAASACTREFREETGLAVAPIRLLGVDSGAIQHYQNGDVAQCVVLFFACRVVGGRLDAANAETAALRYFAPDALPKLFSPQHERALAHYLNGDVPFAD